MADTKIKAMQVITIESDAFQKFVNIMKGLEKRFAELKEEAAKPLGEVWMGNEEVCRLLNISKRTLQNYRDDNLIPFSQINHKIYYRASDIERFLNKNYKRIKNF